MIHLKSKTRKLLSLVLSIVLAAGLLPVGPFAPVEVRAANSVEYLAPDYVDTADVTKGITGFTKKEQDTYTVINSANKPTTWGSDGNTTWYVVEGNVNYGTLGTDPGTITVKGNVNLILKDGCSLNVKGALNYAGICVSGDNDSLTIYGQTEGDGELKASAGSYGAGIGGNQYGAGKNITINGGNITATGSLTGAGIGGAQGDGSNITINGGSVTATSGSGAGIGSGWGKTGSDITINGGSVTAAASEKGAGIGGGCNGAGSGITINGGTVIANGGQAKDNFGAGIGGGSGGNGSNIKISGGKV